jgi:hypothetical protein
MDANSKSFSRFILRSLILLVIEISTTFSHAALPSATQKEIEQLVQQDKITEAVAKVDALLKASPNDANLKKLKSELSALLPAGAAQAKPPAPPAEDRLALANLSTILEDYRAATDPGARKKLGEEFFVASAAYLKAHPDHKQIWLQRALVALDLDGAKEGHESLEALKRLGVDKTGSNDELKLLSRLTRKGWATYETTKSRKANPNQIIPGLSVEPLTTEKAAELGYEHELGVLISDVESDSPAATAGLRRGDLIVEVNRRKVDDMRGFRGVIAISKAEGIDPILVLVKRGAGSRFMVVRMK